MIFVPRYEILQNKELSSLT